MSPVLSIFAEKKAGPLTKRAGFECLIQMMRPQSPE